MNQIEGVRIVKSSSTSELEWMINSAIEKERQRGFLLIDVKTISTIGEVITKFLANEECHFEVEYIATLLFTRKPR